MSVDFGLHEYGERAFLVELEDNDDVHRLAAAVGQSWDGELSEVVPGHCTLLLSWCGERPGRDACARRLRSLFAGKRAAATGDSVTVTIHYDGPDLEEVADRSGLEPADVVRIHSAACYRVAFIGFMPGFAYLLGGDPRLKLPRRAIPRTKVRAGSVAVAGPYSAVYPAAAPGGWNLIGHTEAALFDTVRHRPALLAPGDLVHFEVA